SGGQTDSGEAKAGGADLQLPINNSPGGEAAGLNEQETQKLKSEAQAEQMEKAAFRETHFPSGQEAKSATNLTELTMENKEAGNIRRAQSEKDDFSTGINSRSNTQEIKEFLLKKDHPEKNSSPADIMAENKPQSDAMRTIMGEAAAKIREEQKSKFVAGENLSEEISLTGVNASGGSSAGSEKIKDVSSGKIIDQVAGAIKETATNDGGRVKITLNPPSLGKLEMDVTVRNGKVEVVLVADNKDVQQTLNANIEKLKDSLSNQGLTIDRCDVSLQDNKEEYQQNFSRQAYYQDGGSARDGDGRRGNSEEEINSGAGAANALRPERISRTINDTDNISLFA
ncbi:MAG: flagellar hook-length control protein FliK, partial [Smithellaceae bacterium]